MKNFADKVVVITGAGSGIGRALAQAFDAAGAHLALADIHEAGLAETRSLMSAADHLTVPLDVADRDAFYGFADQVIERFGQVDVVINNAGVAHSELIAKTSYEDFEWIVGINFWGVVYGTKAFLPHLSKRDEACVVNISSVFGLISVPTQGTYNATKFAVRGFTEALRHEMAGGPVHVMCVHPGGIRTPIAHNARFYAGPTGGDREAQLKLFEKMAMTSPEQAAQRIMKGIRKRQARCLIGADAWLVDRIQRWMPVRYWSVFGALLRLQSQSVEETGETA